MPSNHNIQVPIINGMHHPVRTGETNKKRNLKIYPTKVRHVSLIAQAVSQLKPNSEPPAAAILS